MNGKELRSFRFYQNLKQDCETVKISQNDQIRL